MSKIQQMLLIEPNSTKGQKEQYVYTGFTCPFCSGQKGGGMAVVDTIVEMRNGANVRSVGGVGR